MASVWVEGKYASWSRRIGVGLTLGVTWEDRGGYVASFNGNLVVRAGVCVPYENLDEAKAAAERVALKVLESALADLKGGD